MNVDRLVSLIQILNNIIDTKIWLKIKMCIRCVNMIIIKEWNYFRCVGFLNPNILKWSGKDYDLKNERSVGIDSL